MEKETTTENNATGNLHKPPVMLSLSADDRMRKKIEILIETTKDSIKHLGTKNYVREMLERYIKKHEKILELYKAGNGAYGLQPYVSRVASKKKTIMNLADNLPAGAADHPRAPYNEKERFPCPCCDGGESEFCLFCNGTGEVTEAELRLYHTEEREEDF